MGVKIIEILVTLMLNMEHFAYTEHILPCNSSSLGLCPGANQICNLTLNQCLCLEDFILVGNECQSRSSYENDSSGGATAAVVISFTLALVICGLFLVIRKYHLIDYVRQKIIARRNNDVMYEDVMIGQDDPPLTP